MRSADVIVIGAGVAGLGAAAELARRGWSVHILEARDRLGGRIWTVAPRRGRPPIELGAEFVHGGNEVLWQKLKQFGLRTRSVPGRHWRPGDGDFAALDAEKEIASVTRRIDPKRMQGWSFAEFLAGETATLTEESRRLALGFVEGFEAAPANEMSAGAIAGETFESDEQAVVQRGYGALVAAMVRDLPADRVRIFPRAPARSVRWRTGQVEVQTPRGEFAAPKVIVTVPVGVLQARSGEMGAMTFSPRLPDHAAVAREMRMGHVVRVTVAFDGRSWRSWLPPALARHARKGFGFVHSEIEGAPVWWSLSSEPRVTGWVGGTRAKGLVDRSTAALRSWMLAEFGKIFDVPGPRLRAAVSTVAWHNWSADPFSRGAYSFTRAGQEDAAKRLRVPVADTLFFAGEATANGAETGTVHGALASGVRAASEAAGGGRARR